LILEITLKKEWKVFIKDSHNHNSNLKLDSIRESDKFLYRMSHHHDSNLRKIQAFKIQKTYSRQQIM